MKLIKIDYSKNAINAREIYEFVFNKNKKKPTFTVWISIAITRYDFKNGIDFQSFLIKSTDGRHLVDFTVSIEMAKELAMVVPTLNGKKVRQYLIRCEEEYRKQRLTRFIKEQLDNLPDFTNGTNSI